MLVTGFQGVDRNGDVTTLGRGGSDTSAVALAAAFRAELCQIYTDVDGVYTADPRSVQGARKLEEITFEGLEESWRVVVENILENAQRYAQSVITIHLNEQEGLTIANDGPSMDESRIETLFKPFEKGEGGRFGLGLSIVAKVVRANHYEVRGENTADGVIFRIYRNQPKKAKQKTERRSRQRGAKNNNEA